MSNARSPREVCSTTIGTSGLIVLASVSLHRPDSSRPGGWRARIYRLAVRRPQPAGLLRRIWLGASRALGAGALGAFLLGRPQLLARLCLLERDRLGGLRDQLHRAPRREILAQLVFAADGAQTLEQLLGGLLFALGRRREGLQQLLLGGIDR